MRNYHYPRWSELSEADQAQSEPLTIGESIISALEPRKTRVSTEHIIVSDHVTVCPRCGSERTRQKATRGGTITRKCRDCKREYSVRSEA